MIAEKAVEVPATSSTLLRWPYAAITAVCAIFSAVAFQFSATVAGAYDWSIRLAVGAAIAGCLSVWPETVPALWRMLGRLIAAISDVDLDRPATLSIALVLVPAFILVGTGFYVRPVGDDWGAIWRGNYWSIHHDLVQRWQMWTGRYSWTTWSHIQNVLYPWAAGYSSVVLVGLYAAAWYLASAFVRGWRGIALSVSVVTALLVGSPELPTSVYWTCSTNQYPMSLLAYCLVFGWLCRSPRKSLWPLVAVASFAAAGFQEITTLPACIVLSYMAIKHKGPSIAALLGSALGLVLLIVAPGNHVRAIHEGFPTHHSAVLSALHGAKFAVGFVLSLDARAVVPVILCSLFLGAGRTVSPHLGKTLVATATGAAICLWAQFSAGYWAMSTDLMARTEIIPLAVVLAALAIATFTIAPILCGYQSLVAACLIVANIVCWIPMSSAAITALNNYRSDAQLYDTDISMARAGSGKMLSADYVWWNYGAIVPGHSKGKALLYHVNGQPYFPAGREPSRVITN